jgi:Putative Ig domain/Fibronectin type III domain
MVHAGLRARQSVRCISIVLAAAAGIAWCASGMAATSEERDIARHDHVRITGSPAADVTVNQQFAFQPHASDSAGRKLTFEIQNKPAWASFSSTTGELSGKPAAANVGKYSDIVIGATDGSHSAHLPAFAITVVAAATSSTPAPTISGTPSTSDVAGTAYSFQPKATGPSGDTLSFSVQNKPSWASFSIATGLLSGTPTSTQTGTYSNILVSVSDGKSSAALPAFAIVVKPASTTPPVGTGSAVVNWTPPTSNTNGTPLTNLAGIRIYYGTTQANLTQSIQLAANQTTATISNLAAGTWYFAGAVFTSTGAQSAMSSVVSASVP